MTRWLSGGDAVGASPLAVVARAPAAAWTASAASFGPLRHKDCPLGVAFLPDELALLLEDKKHALIVLSKFRNFCTNHGTSTKILNFEIVFYSLQQQILDPDSLRVPIINDPIWNWCNP
jgi:hypothetical protein